MKVVATPAPPVPILNAPPVKIPDVLLCSICAGCTALSARSREAFTLVSSFDSSILHATIEAVRSLAVIVRSISEVSDTVSIVFTSAPVSIPASFVFSA